MHQNITLKLDKNLLHQAKLEAVQRKTSLSQLMVEALNSFLSKARSYDQARRKALRLMKKGFNLGGGPYYSSREELHQRHGR